MGEGGREGCGGCGWVEREGTCDCDFEGVIAQMGAARTFPCVRISLIASPASLCVMRTSIK